MSARSRRNQLATHMLPGMPDVLPKQPPKAAAGEKPKPLTLDQAISRTHEIMRRVIKQYGTGNATSTRVITVPDKTKPAGADGKPAMVTKEIVVNHGAREIAGTYGLYSGGNDSVVLPHLLRDYLDGIVHVNTGTAIAATTQHVREVVPAAWNLPLHELHPRAAYRDLVLGNVCYTRGDKKGQPVWSGFPGPGGDSHAVMYQRLKGHTLEAFAAAQTGRAGPRRKTLLIGGTSWDETDRRFRNAGEITERGSTIWVAPLIHWTNAHMAEYRARHRCQQDHQHALHRLCYPGALPLNEVTEHLHMSGDCTCGCYAKPGELDEIRFFYPADAERIDALQAEVEAAGILACRWGQRPPGTDRRKATAKERSATPFLCSGCPPQLNGQVDLLDLWQASGLISAKQHANLNSPAA